MMEDTHVSPSFEKPLTYLWLALAATWLLWIPSALLSGAYPGVARGLHYAGGLMPLAVALILLYRSHNPSNTREYWRRGARGSDVNGARRFGGGHRRARGR